MRNREFETGNVSVDESAVNRTGQKPKKNCSILGHGADWVEAALDLPDEVRAGVVAGWLNSAAQIISGIFVPAILVRVLGMADYGQYALLLSLSGYVGLLDLGMTTTLVARFGQARAYAPPPRLLSLLRTGLVWVCAGGIGAVIVTSAIGHWWFPRLSLVPWFVAAAVATVAAEFLGAVVRGHGRTDQYNIVTAGATFLNGIGCCGAAYYGYGLAGLAGAQIGSAALRFAIFAWHVRRILPKSDVYLGPLVNPIRDLRIGFSDQMTRIWLNLLSPSLRIALAGAGGIVALATYDLASRMVSAVVIPPSAFLPALLPAFASRIREPKEIAKLLSHSINIMGALVLPLSAFVGLFVGPLANVWLGSYPEELVLVTRLLLLANCWNLCTGPFSQALLGAGRPELCNQKALLSIFMSLALSLPLTFIAGLRGYVFGELAAYFVSASWFLVRYPTSLPIKPLLLLMPGVTAVLRWVVPAAATAVLVHELTWANEVWETPLAWVVLFFMFAILAWMPWVHRATRGALDD